MASILALQAIVGQDDARTLMTGDIGARHEALTRIAAIPPSERSEQMWQALRQEVDRLVACLDIRPPSQAERQALHCDIRPKSEDDYLPNLITTLGQSRDPSIIPTLIRVAPSGALASGALVRFGELGVPALIESAMSSRSGPWGDESSGAMLTLARMLEQSSADSSRALRNAAKIRITDTARTVLHSKLTWVNQIAIVGLALATGDADLRSEVEVLATDPSEWRRRGVTDQARVAQLQNSIRFQLARHPKP